MLGFHTRGMVIAILVTAISLMTLVLAWPIFSPCSQTLVKAVPSDRIEDGPAFQHPSDAAVFRCGDSEAKAETRFISKSVEKLDRSVFDFLSGDSPHSMQLRIVRLVAEQSGWVCVAILFWTALRRPRERKHVAMAFILAAFTSLLSKEIAEALALPRPFMVGAAQQFIEHGARPGFPSTHASVLFVVAFLSLARAGMRRGGWFILGVAIATSWARIYVGVHFPLDIVAGAVLAGFGWALCFALGWSHRNGESLRSEPGFR